jgi:hypothetical protein
MKFTATKKSDMKETFCPIMKDTCMKEKCEIYNKQYNVCGFQAIADIAGQLTFNGKF